MNRTWSHVRTVVVCLLAGRFLYLLIAYLAGYDTGRFRVESAAALLIAVGLLLRIGTRAVTPTQKDVSPPGLGWLGLFVGLAFLLYWPALSIGFLSDDAVLIARARAWDLGPQSSILFRPVPLALWAFLGTAGAGAAVFHAVNIALHGVNAYLTSRVAAGWVERRLGAVLAGGLLLVSPLGPESVAWCAGLFDVAATSMTLALILVARNDGAVSSGRRGAFVFLALVAVGCKETGIVAPALVLLDAWVTGRLNRRLVIDVAGIAVVFVGYAAIRLVYAFDAAAPPMTRYVIQRSLFETFGGLAMPWHGDVVHARPWMPFLGAAVVVVPLIAVLLSRASSVRTVGAAAAWALIAVAPVFPVIILPADLQGSRYFYLASVGWAVLLVDLIGRTPSAAVRQVLLGAAGCLVLANAAALRLELRPWQAAAALREQVTAALRDRPAPAGCDRIALAALPDNARGAYVFRVGAVETLTPASAVPISSDAPAECTLTWHPESGRFVR